MALPRNAAAVLDHPEWIDQELAERSLAEFVKQAWPYVDPKDYVHGWHIDAVSEHLEAVSRQEIRKLVINEPPRHMKSIETCVMWPAWTWMQDAGVDEDGEPLPVRPGTWMGPGCQWMHISYAQPLSIRDSVKCRRLIDSPWYQKNWGDRFKLTTDQNTKIRFDNDRAGYRLSTSVDGQGTGEGGDIIVIDDPHNVKEAESETVRQDCLDWWDEVMPTRLNDLKTGAFVIICQRVHENDLSGHVLERDGWTHLCLPARYERKHPFPCAADRRERDGEPLWEEKFGEPELEELETNLGSYAAAGQLQQRPAPRSGGMFDRQWFQIVDQAPVSTNKVRYWDKAATELKPKTDPDWTRGCLMSEKDGVYCIEDFQGLRGTPRSVQDLIRQTAETDGRDVPVWIEQEGGSSGKEDIDNYQRKVLKGFSCRGDRVTGSKTVRADPLSAAAEAGNVKLVKGPWNRDFLDEISLFPMGKHDDQVDAASGARDKLTAPKKGMKRKKLKGF